MNSRARVHWQQVAERRALPAQLAEIAESKFVSRFGCVLQEAMIPSYLLIEPNSNFFHLPEHLGRTVQDETGLECFVSKVHIDGFVSSDHLAVAVSYLTDVFESFKAQFPDESLRGIISLHEPDEPDTFFSCCVRAHVIRNGQSWLTSDIEDYREAVFAIDSDETLPNWRT